MNLLISPINLARIQFRDYAANRYSPSIRPILPIHPANLHIVPYPSFICRLLCHCASPLLFIPAKLSAMKFATFRTFYSTSFCSSFSCFLFSIISGAASVNSSTLHFIFCAFGVYNRVEHDEISQIFNLNHHVVCDFFLDEGAMG